MFARLQLAIATAVHQQWQPADLKFEAVVDEQVGAAHTTHETGTRINEVRVLATTGDGLHVYEVSANCLGQRGQICRGGYNV